MERLKFLKKLKVSEEGTTKIFSFGSLLQPNSIHSNLIKQSNKHSKHPSNSIHSLPFRIIVLIERDFTTLYSIFNQDSFNSFFQYTAETFVVPLTEPNLNSVIDLFLIWNRFVNNTSARYVITIVQTLADQTQNHCLPNLGQFCVILFYTIIIITIIIIILPNNTRILPPRRFCGSSYFGSIPSLNKH